MATRVLLRRLRNPLLVLFAATACTAHQMPRADFENELVREIERVVDFHPPDFASVRAPDAGFLLYENGQVQPIKCERAVLLGLLTNGTRSGSIGAGVCTDVKRIEALTASSKERGSTFVDWFKKSGATISDPSLFTRPEWVNSRTAGPDGSEVHYFPVAITGQGLAVFPTVVLIARDARQAVIVQANIDPVCSDVKSPLCSNTVTVLREVAQRVYTRVRERR